MLRNIWKRAIQIFLYLIEISIVTLVLTRVSIIIEPVKTFWNLIERGFFSYGIYQFLVYILLANCNDIRKDSYLALLEVYREIKLYFDYEDEFFLNRVTKSVEYQLQEGTLNDADIRKEYSNIDSIIKKNSRKEVEWKIVLFEHLVEESTLNWKYSFLLRIVK